jgi:molybdopterin-guanine dinucleotide biosynthesis protein A
MPDDLASNVTLAVLAGGAGARMGRAKGELVIGNMPMLQFLLDRLAWLGPTLLVTAPGRERPPGSERFEREVSDTVAGEGPLRGVLTALDHIDTETAIIITVDMPNVALEQLQWLQMQLNLEMLGVMLRRNAGGGELIEPFPLVVRRTAAPVIRERLALGERSVHRLSSVAGFEVRAAPDAWPASTWVNLNDLADYKAFVASLKR